jgi:PAS domain-containing protein
MRALARQFVADQVAPPAAQGLPEHKALFDHSWTLAIVLATALVIISWYLGFTQIDVGPVIWCLASLALVQFLLNAATRNLPTESAQQKVALCSQLLGTLMLGIAWHMFGGVQQPLFPLLLMLPLLSSSVLLPFWHQQIAVLSLILLLASAAVLSPDTNSFIEQHYGLGISNSSWLPAWMPRSRVAFPNVVTSPPYELSMMGCMAVMALAVSTTARAVVMLCSHAGQRLLATGQEIERVQRINHEIITRSPYSEVMVLSASGRIVESSERFRTTFSVNEKVGGFLIDTVAFSYPAVIKRLCAIGGEDIQRATIAGRPAVLRIAAVLIGSGPSQVTRLVIERCDDVCWRTALDALEQPVFAVHPGGEILFLNLAARAAFGADSEGASAAELFNTTAHWWDIAPLRTARRMLDRDGQSYLATIRLERIAESVGDLAFIDLQQRHATHAAAAS